MAGGAKPDRLERCEIIGKLKAIIQELEIIIECLEDEEDNELMSDTINEDYEMP